MTRRALNGVLHGFLGTYVSRYSDYSGYWLFGFIVESLSHLEIDLLGRADLADAPAAPIEAARALAVSRFREQLTKAGLSMHDVSSATLVLDRLSAHSGLAGLRERAGFDVRFKAEAVAITGRAFAREEIVFVAPHDPALELRAARPMENQH